MRTPDPRFDPEPKTYKTAEQMPHGASPLTVTEAMQWCLDKGLSPDDVTITGGHFIWDRTETPEEIEKRIAYATAAQERHEQWVRDAYARLTDPADRGTGRDGEGT